MASELQKKRPKKLRADASEPERLLEALTAKISESQTPFDPRQHKDETRAAIAFFFVKGFFYLIAFCLIFIPLYNLVASREGLEILSLKDILSAISGLVSGLLGFVIGHYFKSDSR